MKKKARRKKKRKFNPKKFIKTWSVIISVIVIIVMITDKKEGKEEKEEKQKTQAKTETVETTATVTNDAMKEETEKLEINSKISDWNLMLVNKDKKVPEGYRFHQQTIENGYQVDNRIVEPLNQMLTDARKQGLDPFICSAYRATSTQKMLFDQKVNEHINLGYSKKEAEEKASYWVTFPQTSEHEIGLAVDIISEKYKKLDETQEDTEVQKWLMEHCTEYGFILRYPTYKHEITKINYEPWHYRYVGIENAKYMKEKELCLEEYIEKLKNL